jgi:hypothetical protein
MRTPLALPALLLACCASPAPSAPSPPHAPQQGRAEPPAAAPRLSSGTLRVLSGLQRQVTLQAFVTKGVPALDEATLDLADALREYEGAANGKLAVETTVVDSDERRHEASRLGLPERHQGGTPHHLGVVVGCGDRKLARPLTAATGQPLEHQLTLTIRNIHAEATGAVVRVGVITGHQEQSLSEPQLTAEEDARRPSVRSAMAEAFPSYRLEDIDLASGAALSAPDLAALVLTQPGSPYTEAELRLLDAFLMRGSRGVAVFSSAVHMRPGDPTMAATIAPDGLGPLLSAYGIEPHVDTVLDWQSSIRLTVPREGGGSGKVIVRAPAILTLSAAEGSELDDAFAPLDRVGDLALPFSSSLAVHPQKQPACRVAVRASTSLSGWSVSDRKQPLGLRADWAPAPDLERLAVAASAEGPLASAFGGGSAPGGARVVVFSSGQFLANPFARQGNPARGPDHAPLPGAPGDLGLRTIARPYAEKYTTSTMLALKNTLDWVTSVDVPTTRWKRAAPAAEVPPAAR